MAALPSFVELMSSLGLAADASGSRSPSLSSSSSLSPKLSNSPLHVPVQVKPEKENTPAIVVSQPKSAEKTETKRRTNSGSSKAMRYSPYAPVARRESSSSTSDSKSDSESAKSTSSRRSSTNARDASSGLTITERRALRRLHVAATPISSFARRHSPHASPTTPAFVSQRPRAAPAGLPSPVMLPTLPPMLTQSLTAFAFPSGSGERRGKDKDRKSISRSPTPNAMIVDSDSAFVKQNPAGLRISSLHRQVEPIA